MVLIWSAYRDVLCPGHLRLGTSAPGGGCSNAQLANNAHDQSLSANGFYSRHSLVLNVLGIGDNHQAGAGRHILLNELTLGHHTDGQPEEIEGLVGVTQGVQVGYILDIILLENSLLVLEQGVLEGRRVFGNIVKYIKMAASSNFGNMFSVVGASAFLPFLPMLPIQVLVNNLMYDFSQTTSRRLSWLFKALTIAIGGGRLLRNLPVFPTAMQLDPYRLNPLKPNENLHLNCIVPAKHSKSCYKPATMEFTFTRYSNLID